MPRKRLSMRNIREILRLKHSNNAVVGKPVTAVE